MHVHCVGAEQLGVAPLLSEGPSAQLRYKFVLIENHFVYGNVRSHLDLAAWLLKGPLSPNFPAAIGQARPILESEHVLTVFGGYGFQGHLEMTVYITPPKMSSHEIEQLVVDVVHAYLSTREVA